MSVDTHKFGMAHKGTSVVLYRSPDVRRHQFTQVRQGLQRTHCNQHHYSSIMPVLGLLAGQRMDTACASSTLSIALYNCTCVVGLALSVPARASAHALS